MLLNLIDHLPSFSHTGEAMAHDEEALRAAVVANGGTLPESSPPSMANWSTEAGLLATAIHELRALKSILIQANSAPGKAAPKMEMVPMPESAWPRIANEVRLSRHREMVARLIPSERRNDPPL